MLCFSAPGSPYLPFAENSDHFFFVISCVKFLVVKFTLKVKSQFVIGRRNLEHSASVLSILPHTCFGKT